MIPLTRAMDTLVIAQGQQSVVTLEQELQDSDLETHFAGDCLSPRSAEEAIYEARKQEGREFIKKYKKKEGVKQLEEGVYYRSLDKGRGVKPQEGSRLMVTMRMSLVDGSVVYDKSDKNKPVPFYVNKLIPGLQQAALQMKEGDWWEVAIPWKQAYGRRSGIAGAIPPFSTLLCELRILKVD